ncbi:MAG: hemolysin III family protein [Planctomycetota bacterium]
MIALPTYSRGQETANSITHGLGIVLSVAGLAVLVVLAALRGTAWHVVSFSVYGVTLVLLFTASTLYHSFRSPRVKRVLRVIDHSSIYLLIAGSYTPLTLVPLRGAWGWSLFGCVWAIALAGIFVKAYYTGRFRLLSTLVYLALGWLAVVAVKPLLGMLPVAGFLWLLAGGVVYSSGTVFYSWKKLPYHHAIWHLFVLAASICHYIAIVLYVLPSGGG